MGYERCRKESDRRDGWRPSTRIPQTLFPMLWRTCWYNGEVYLHGASGSAGDCQVSHRQVQGDVGHHRTPDNSTLYSVFGRVEKLVQCTLRLIQETGLGILKLHVIDA